MTPGSAVRHASVARQVTDCAPKFGMFVDEDFEKLLQRNDRAMIRQICSIKPKDVATLRSSELMAKLELDELDLILRERLCWFGHVERSSGAVRAACHVMGYID